MERAARASWPGECERGLSVHLASMGGNRPRAENNAVEANTVNHCIKTLVIGGPDEGGTCAQDTGTILMVTNCHGRPFPDMWIVSLS